MKRSVGMEAAARRWMDVALMVPETLLHVATSGEVLTVIDEAYDRVGGDSSLGGEEIEGDYEEIILDETTGGVESSNDSARHRFIQCWGNELAHAFTAAHREMTRLLSLHGEAGNVFAVCAARLGLTNGGEPWQRRRLCRAAAVARAHDALLRLGSAASAAAAIQDLLLARVSPETPPMKGLEPAVRVLMEGTRRDVDEARDAVKLMRYAVAREFFETWMILKRARVAASVQRRPRRG